ncbi:uncharacterized protein LOC129716869 [Wyeomyia smithii]|uniref:uncharacterized protein LOC129716869 n=1 Tax=Wyeomyia smithii TaxID=174621 RepID=UPI002467DF41|nr:uncharacterized protein LOC129716869 [Wyeomyia smithii]
MAQRSNHTTTAANIPGAVMNAVLLPGKLNIVHGNTQSLCARKFGKLDELKLTLQNPKISIACFTESWLTENIRDNCISIPGYSMLRNDRGYSRGGGIIVYFRTNLRCTKLFCTELTSNAQDKTECLALDINVNNEKVLLLVIYNPPDNDCSRFLADRMCELSDSYENIVVIGDLNTDLLQPSRKRNNLTSVFESFSLTCLGDEPTYFHNTGCSQLDLFVTNIRSKVRRFDQVSFSGLSQHDLIFATLEFEVTRSQPNQTFRDYVNFNAQAVAQAVLSVPWNEFYGLSDIDELTNFFNFHIKRIHDLHIPLRVVHANRRINPWFNVVVRRAIVERELAYREWLRSPSHLKELKRQHYKTLRNRANLVICRAKRAYFERYFDDHVDTKNLWSRVRSLGVTGKVSAQDCNFDPDEVNDVFLSNCTTVQPPYRHTDNAGAYSDSFGFSTIAPWQVTNAAWESKSNAVGSDGIPIKFLKILLPLIVEHITFLFNKIITTATFPDTWKQIIVLPIKKKTHLNTLTSLRPISILCALSKIFEKLIEQQISAFLREYNLLSEHQAGFQKGQSVKSAVLKVADDIGRSLDKNGIGVLLLLDFSKAFDTGSHHTLCRKLRTQFSFSTEAVRLVESYLSKRMQAVLCGQRLSRSAEVCSGIPQ